MNINRAPEQEKMVKDAPEAGRIRLVQELVGEALQAVCETGQTSSPSTPSGAQREAVREMLALGRKAARAWKACL
jgi:hypothetical protein